MNWIFVLFGISWVAAFTSQSLIDISDTLIIGAALYTAFKRYEWKVFFTSFKPAWLWPTWLVVIVLGLVLNANLQSEETWKDLLEFRWILTFLSWIYLLQKTVFRKNIFTKIGLITLILNISALAMWLRYPEQRAGGLLNAIMAFAHNIGPVFCLYSILTLTNWKNFKNQEKILYFAVTITAGILTVVTFTRGIWIGCIVALLATTFLWNRKLFAGVVGSLVIIFLIGIGTSDRIYNRVFNKTANETESNQERKALWQGNWEMVKEHPVLGVGLGTNKSHLRKYYDIFGYPETQRQSHAHNQYLQYWAGTGTLGLFCYLIFLFFVLKYSFVGFKKRIDISEQHIQLALFSALICFMVGSLTESNFNIAKNRFFFLLLAGAAVAWAGPQRKKPNHQYEAFQ